MASSRYILELEALESPIPPVNRLRRLLKYALRTLGLRCRAAREIQEDPNVLDLPSLARLALSVRRAQRDYFRNPSHGALERARAVERQLDQAIQDILQPKLFGGPVESPGPEPEKPS